MQSSKSARRQCTAAAWLLASTFLFCSQAMAARLALVIGNDTYEHVTQLRNARADAQTMADALRTAGYSVDLKIDRTQREMLDDVRSFRQRIKGGDEVVFFFSGHGVQIGASNHLLPTNVRSQNEDQVRDDALELSRVLADLRSARPAFTLAIIDACRDNPFAGAGRAIGGRGLTGVAGANGQMVIYAAGEGQQALDRLGNNDTVRNGLFTRVFSRELQKPGVPVHQVLRNVRVEVSRLAQTVGHVQVPAIYDQALGDFYFVAGTPGSDPGPSAAAVPGTVAQPVPLVPTPGPTAGQTIKDCSDCPELVVMGTGSFTMGSPAGESDRAANEGPQRTVTVGRAFALGRYEVTVGEFRRFVSASNYVTEAERNVGAKGCYTWDDGDGKAEWREGRSWRSPGFEQKDNQPVVCVSWNDAQAYLRWLSQKTGQAYRLPSEAEWEYAARAGSSGSRPWGEDPKEACRHGNVADQSRSPSGKSWNSKHECNDGFWYTAPVGSYAANRFGVYDMMGNAWEWTQDVWHENYNGAPTDGSVWSAGGDQARRVLRGGSWDNNPQDLRSADRIWGTPGNRFNGAGFRIARTL